MAAFVESDFLHIKKKLITDTTFLFYVTKLHWRSGRKNMQKLKIRQYWTNFNRPWYIIRYGHNSREYLTANNKDLPYMIKVASERLKNGQGVQNAS